MEILRIYINITETNELISENVTVRMILFDGFCTGEFFNGVIMAGGADTQLIKPDNIVTLSARYMLKGTDRKNNPCHIFIENNAEAENGVTYTKPVIFTDSKDLKWLEHKELEGRIENEEGKLVIIIKIS